MSCIHGGDIYSGKIKYDFSANINPLGLPRQVKSALTEQIDLFSNYPDTKCRGLKKAIAEHGHICADNIVCTGGAIDLIYRAVKVIRPKKAMLLAPSFTEYQRAIEESGGATEYYYRKESIDFALDEDFLDALNESKAIEMLILCNPNNPTGDITRPRLMGDIAKACKSKGIWLVVDECFLEFSEDFDRYKVPLDYERLLVVRAFTKIYAMAGLRLGYGMCSDKDFIEKLEEAGLSWSVSVPAQLAGIEALSCTGFIEKTRKLISKEREYLSKGLSGLGFKVYPSEGNFILFKTLKEQALREALLDEGIAIRQCGDFKGLNKSYYRAAVRTRKENKILLDTIKGLY